MYPSLSCPLVVGKYSDNNAEFVPYDISDMVDSATHKIETLINDNIDPYEIIEECEQNNFMDNFIPSDYL